MTDAPLPDGWIRHAGGPCPVPLDSKPGIVSADRVSVSPGISPARKWTLGIHDNWWTWDCPPADRIIAYRPEPKP